MPDDPIETTVETAEATPPNGNGKRRPIVLAVFVVVALVGATIGVRAWLYNSAHVTTDDAFLTSDVVPISARVPGNVASVLVTDNQHVEKGDVLVTLDDSTYAADLRQAEANLALAQANVGGAVADTGLTTKSSQAEIAGAAAGVSASGSGVESAVAGVGKARGGVQTAQAVLGAAEAQDRSAQSTVEARRAALDAARHQVVSLEAMVPSGIAAVNAAIADESGAKARADNDRKQADRLKRLLDYGAVSQADWEAADTVARWSLSQALAASQDVLAAKATLEQRKAALASARSQVNVASAELSQAVADQQAAAQNAKAERERLGQARDDLAAAQAAVKSAGAQRSQAEAALSGARTLDEKTAVARSGEKVALAKLRQAQAAYDAAQVAFDRTRLKAPVSGNVSRRNVQLGQQVMAGQPLLAVIPDETPWIVANLKETQLSGVRLGAVAEVHVDAIPDQTFLARVESVSQGTGSVFALLPPDNASGNFTKVVQRVPVKLVLDPGQPHLDRLRAGLSVTVAIRKGAS